MAQPVFSFKNSTEKIRYYFILNTYGDLPQSIPMDIISFLNYMRYRVDNYENFTRIFHQIYPELVETGSSLDSIGFDDLSHPLRKQLIAISALRYNITGDALFFSQIEELFITERNFKRFFYKLSGLIKDIRKDLPRPLEFYDSWKYTFDAIDQSQRKSYFLKKLIECGFICNENEFIAHFLIKKLANKRNHSALVRFFTTCLIDSKIPLNAVPHVFRSAPEIKKIFLLYGAELLVPETAVNSDYRLIQDYSWASFPMKDKLLKRFTEQCLHSDFYVADEIINKISELGRPLYDLTDDELYSVNGLSFPNDNLQNYSNASGNYLFPFRFLSKLEYTDVIFLAEIHANNLVPFGTKRLNRITSESINFIQSINGKLIEVNPSGIFGDEQIWWNDIENSSLNYLRKSNVSLGDFGFNPAGTGKFSEGNSFYFLCGWFDLKNKPISPLCFTSAGRFSEGLAPVCLNGKWGFVDTAFSLVIEAQFGHAEPFDNGRAKVFLLNKRYKKERGKWVDLPTWISLSEDDSCAKSEKEFARKYPAFPSKHRIPVSVLSNRSWNTNQKELGYYGNNLGLGLLPGMGRYVFIDRLGNILDADCHEDLPANGIEIIAYDGEQNKRYGKKIEDENYMLKSMIKREIDYRDLPLHYKIKDDFIHLALTISTVSLNEIPLQFRKKANNIVKQINRKKSKQLINDKLKSVLKRRKPIKSEYELLLIHSGKADDMQFRALKIKHKTNVQRLIRAIGNCIFNLYNAESFTSDYNVSAHKICEKLKRSGKFEEPEMEEFSILLNPEGSRTLMKKHEATTANERPCFHFFCGDELYQPDSYSAFFSNQFDTGLDYHQYCTNYLMSYPIKKSETPLDIYRRLVRHLKQKGAKQLAHLECPISESTIGHLIQPKVAQAPLVISNLDVSECDNLPF